MNIKLPWYFLDKDISDIKISTKYSLNRSVFPKLMIFNTINRDGPARIGEIQYENKKIKTPNIFYVNTNRFKAPGFAEIFLNKEIEKNSFIVSSDEDFNKIDENLIIVRYALQLLNQPRDFVNFIVKLREKIGYQKIIYLPSAGDPTNFALLTYLGIDLFDSTSAIIAARNNIMFFSSEKINKENLNENPCNCPICLNSEKNPSEMNFNEILTHNYNIINYEIKSVRNAIINQNLRNVVERKVRADPNLTAILKNLDRNHFNYLEKRVPITLKNKIIATTSESMNRPEIIRFQQRVINRYKKPNSAKILLLLPCSAKKPYFLSKTHKFFREKLLSTNNPFIVHELIITSPLGIVPRELEIVYPANNYDIPVTGVWDEHEKKLIILLLTDYLKKNSYEKIIVHLPKELVNFIKPILKNPIITCVDSPTSDKSLKKLEDTLNKFTKDYKKVNPFDRSIEDMESILLYQFGEDITKKLMKDSTVKGKYPNRKLFRNSTQIGMVFEERGLLSLTIPGGKLIEDSKEYFVDIHNDFKLIGSVFAPGVKKADEKIRIGDEVIVRKNKKICAVGVAQMNGEEMNSSKHGEAVKVRHIA